MMNEEICILGLAIRPAQLDIRGKLPLLYSQDYLFFTAEIDQKTCILLRYQGDYLSIPRIQKHMREIPLLLGMRAPCALWLERANAAQQARLLKNRVPFVIDGNAVYLPFLCMYFDAKPKQDDAPLQAPFTIAEQCVFLWLLYHRPSVCSVSELRDALQISYPTVSRALRRLHQRALLTVFGKNTRKKYSPIEARLLWDGGKEFMVNPVHYKRYAEEHHLLPDIKAYIAGEEALSLLSMLTRPEHACRAVDMRFYSEIKTIAAETPDDLYTENYLIVEIWHYDPALFAAHDTVDVFSLYASLGSKLADERVESEMEGLLEEYFNDSRD